MNNMVWAPFLQQAYYEIGPDPRNLYGLGLQTGSSDSPCVPAFLSHVQLI